MLDLKKNRKNQRGDITVYMAVIILSTMFIVCISWAKIAINNIKMSRELGFATPSFYAAESGAERSLYQVRYRTGSLWNNGNGGTLTGTLSNGGNYSAVWDPVTSSSTIISTGELQRTSRRIEINW